MPACQAPLSMGFSGKNTGVGSHSHLQVNAVNSFCVRFQAQVQDHINSMKLQDCPGLPLSHPDKLLSGYYSMNQK